MATFTKADADDDRCVFKKEGNYYKIFNGMDGKTDFMREYFIGRLLNESRSASHLVKTKDSGVIDTEMRKEMLGTAAIAGKCTNLIEQNQANFYVRTAPVANGEAKPLSKYIEERDGVFEEKEIREIAFQVSWLLAEMHSEFGVQHNDIHEGNIMVRQLDAPKDFNYRIESSGDLFSFQSKLEIFIFDFGASELHDGTKPAKDEATTPWRYSSGIALQHNNAPENLFGDKEKKSEGDLFMFGHVLLSLVAHQRWKNFKYVVENGVHTWGMRLPVSFSLDENAQELVRFSMNRMDNGVFSQELDIDTKNGQATHILSALLAIGRTFDSLGDIDNISFENIYWKAFAKDPDIISYGNTLDFRSLFVFCKELKCSGFIRRLMDFDPVIRKTFGVPGETYGMTTALFHPYFAEFHQGTGGKGNTDIVLAAFAPALEYNRIDKDVDTKKEVISLEEFAFGGMMLGKDEELQKMMIVPKNTFKDGIPANVMDRLNIELNKTAETINYETSNDNAKYIIDFVVKNSKVIPGNESALKKLNMVKGKRLPKDTLVYDKTKFRYTQVTPKITDKNEIALNTVANASFLAISLYGLKKEDFSETGELITKLLQAETFEAINQAVRVLMSDLFSSSRPVKVPEELMIPEKGKEVEDETEENKGDRKTGSASTVLLPSSNEDDLKAALIKATRGLVEYFRLNKSGLYSAVMGQKFADVLHEIAKVYNNAPDEFKNRFKIKKMEMVLRDGKIRERFRVFSPAQNNSVLFENREATDLSSGVGAYEAVRKDAKNFKTRKQDFFFPLLYQVAFSFSALLSFKETLQEKHDAFSEAFWAFATNGSVKVDTVFPSIDNFIDDF